MANELQYFGDTDTESGLTVVARIYDATGVQSGADIPTTEAAGAAAIYVGNMPTVAAGQYGVRFFNGSVLLGQGCINWDGTAEINDVTLDADVDAISAAITALNDLSAADVAAELVSYDAAVPADLASLATAAAVSAIPTNPLLATDARLDNLDATVSSRESEASAATRATTNVTEHDATQAAVAALPTPLTAAEVNAEVDTALADYDGPTKAELDAAEANI